MKNLSEKKISKEFKKYLKKLTNKPSEDEEFKIEVAFKYAMRKAEQLLINKK